MGYGTLPHDINEDGTGPAPERFKDYTEVQSVCRQMISDDRRRSLWRADIDKLWGGAPTYTMGQLRAANQSWRARVNYRELEGIVSAEQTLDYDLETEVETIIDIDLDYGKGQEQRDWADCIEKHFTWMVTKRWDDFNFHTPFRIFQKLLHGMGTHVWTSPNGSWCPRTPRSGMVLFPEECPLNFHEDGDFFMLRDFQPAHAVYRFIEDEKTSAKLGWKPDLVWKALAQSGQGANCESSPERLAKKMRNGDIGASAKQGGIWLNHLFVREIETGKISHYIVAETAEVGGYLFAKRNRFDDWPLVNFPYDIGNGTIQSVRGLGARTKDFFELSNRIKNAMADQVQISSYPQFRQMQQNLDPDKLKLMKVGAMSIAPFGLEPSLIQYPPLGNGPIALSRELQQTMLFNNRGGMAGQDVEPTDRMTGQEYMARAQNASKLNNGSVSFQRSNLRKSYEKMLRLALQPSSSGAPWAVMAREFRKRCDRDGVPTEAFQHIDEVRARTNRGKGSAAAQLQNLMTLMQTVYPATTEDRKIAIERDIVAATFGYGEVNRYARNVTDGDLPEDEDSFIALENDALSRGGEAVAVPKQNHVRHLQGHLLAGQNIAAAEQQGQMDVQTAYAALNALGMHCGGSKERPGHLFYLHQNPLRAAEFRELEKAWKELAGTADTMARDIERQKGQPTPEEQVSDGLKIGMAKVQGDAQIKSAKAHADALLKMRKQAFNERMAAAKTSQELRHAAAKTAAGITLSAAETHASIARDSAKARAGFGKQPA